MTSVELLGSHAENPVELVIAWLKPLRRTGAARVAGDPLPFTLVTHVGGSEDPATGFSRQLVQVDTLCDIALGYAAAFAEGVKTHDRMTLLARHCDCGSITLADTFPAAVDYVNVAESPRLIEYEDVRILRVMARYQIGLSYVAASPTTTV